MFRNFNLRGLLAALLLLALIAPTALPVAAATSNWKTAEWINVPGCAVPLQKRSGEEAFSLTGPATVEIKKGYTFYYADGEYKVGQTLTVPSGQVAYMSFNDQSGGTPPTVASAPANNSPATATVSAPPVTQVIQTVTVTTYNGRTVTLTDIEGHWSKGYVMSAVKAGAISGYTDNSFRPNGNITRGEFAAVVASYFGFTYTGTTTSTHWAYRPMAALAEAGVAPTSWGLMELDWPITREEVTYVLEKSLGLQAVSANVSFSDAGHISLYARDSVKNLVGHGIISGYTDGTFKPQSPITRGEAATIIMRGGESWWKSTYNLRVPGLEPEIFIKDGDAFKAVLSKNYQNAQLPTGVKLHGNLHKGDMVTLEVDNSVARLPIPLKNSTVSLSNNNNGGNNSSSNLNNNNSSGNNSQRRVTVENWLNLKEFTFMDRKWKVGNDGIFTYADSRDASFKAPEGMTVYADTDDGWKEYPAGKTVKITRGAGSATMSFYESIFDFSLFKDPVFK